MAGSSSCQFACAGSVLRYVQPTTRISHEPDADRLRSLGAFDHVDDHPLAFRQIGDAAATERRGMHEDVSAAAVPYDEPEPLIGVVPLHHTELLDRDLI